MNLLADGTSDCSTGARPTSLRSRYQCRPIEEQRKVAEWLVRCSHRQHARRGSSVEGSSSGSWRSAVRPSSPLPSPASSTSPESPREARRARLRGRHHRLARRGWRIPRLQVGHEARVGRRLRPEPGPRHGRAVRLHRRDAADGLEAPRRGPRRAARALRPSSPTGSPSSSTSGARSMSCATASTTTASRSGSRSSSPPTA